LLALRRRLDEFHEYPVRINGEDEPSERSLDGFGADTQKSVARLYGAWDQRIELPQLELGRAYVVDAPLDRDSLVLGSSWA
jgi:hypothetical protein